jgi:protein translocase SecG subunit
MEYFLGTLFIVICILLIIVVLLQRGRGGGLGAAFGGAGSSAFGTRTGDVFTWVTIVLTALFLLLAIGTSLYFRPVREQVPKPTFSPKPGPIAMTTEVSIRCRNHRAQIFYTTDGSDPAKDAPNAKEYNIPEPVEPGTTIKARAYLEDWEPSELAVGEYPLAVPTTAAPTFSPPAGEIDQPIDVTIDCESVGAVIRYTTDGSDPTGDSPVYAAPIRILPGTTLKARARYEDWEPSDVATAAYPKAPAAPTTRPATRPPAGTTTRPAPPG